MSANEVSCQPPFPSRRKPFLILETKFAGILDVVAYLMINHFSQRKVLEKSKSD